MTDKTIEKDRYVNRRKMAWWSFRLIVIVGLPIIVFGLWSDEQAARVGSLNLFLGTVFGVWVAVILAYFGATTFTDRKEIDAQRSIIETDTELD